MSAINLSVIDESTKRLDSTATERISLRSIGYGTSGTLGSELADLLQVLIEIFNQPTQFSLCRKANAIVPQGDEYLSREGRGPNIGIAKNLQEHVPCVLVFHRLLGRSLGSGRQGH